MNQALQKFLELERKKSEVKKFFEELSEATAALAKEIGVNSYFQDAEGTVYKIVVPSGRFVHYETISYIRTRRGDEKKGDLSMKEAEGAGFTLPSKD
jgi:hypothetical protein